VSPSGGKRTITEFEPARVVKILIEDGRTVGKLELDADIVRYSDSDHGEDLALLRLRRKGFTKVVVPFFLEDKPPPLGTELYHCGSLLGQMGANSLTTGIVSQHGRLVSDKVYDQTTCTAFPGSSGGALCLKSDGRYIAMLVRGAGEGFNLSVPMRRIRAWARKTGIEFTLDPKLDVPAEDKIKTPSVEENGAAPPDRGLMEPIRDDHSENRLPLRFALPVSK
jgi:hypothetical protein